MMSLKEKKQKIIDDIIEQNKHAPPQGSKEWVADRKFTIGGSVMSTIIDKDIPDNKSYGTVRNLAAQKVELEEFRTMPAMRWGNLCEPISRMYTEHILNTTISETGAVSGRIANHKYSPDGMGVVSMRRLERLLNSDDDSESDSEMRFEKYDEVDDYDCVLFEYKNPFSRIPNGKIMTGYQIQMQTGMYTIPAMSMGLFVDSVIRRCSLEDLCGDSSYNTEYHKPNYKTNPLSWGFIGVYEEIPEKKFPSNGKIYPVSDDLSSDCDVSEVSSSKSLNMEDIQECIRADSSKSRYSAFSKNTEKDEAVVFDDKSDFIDFGSCSTRDFDKFTQAAITNKVFKLFYTQPKRGQFKYFTWLNKFLNFCKEGKFNPIGVMPWKMFQLELVPLRKDPHFWKPIYQQRIDALIDFVRKYHDKTKQEKQIALEKYFPRFGGGGVISEAEEDFLMKHGIIGGA